MRSLPGLGAEQCGAEENTPLRTRSRQLHHGLAAGTSPSKKAALGHLCAAAAAASAHHLPHQRKWQPAYPCQGISGSGGSKEEGLKGVERLWAPQKDLMVTWMKLSHFSGREQSPFFLQTTHFQSCLKMALPILPPTEWESLAEMTAVWQKSQELWLDP